MYSLVPFILIISINILLIYEIKRQVGTVQSDAKKAKHRAMNRLVITMALLFVLFTLPGAVITSILNKVLQEWGISGYVIINLCDAFIFSYHGLNWLIVMLTNKRFLIEVKLYLSEKFGTKIVKIGDTSTKETKTTDK